MGSQLLATRWPVISQGTVILDRSAEATVDLCELPQLGPLGSHRQFIFEIFNSNRSKLTPCEFENVEIIIQSTSSKKNRLRPKLNPTRRNAVKFMLDHVNISTTVKISAKIKATCKNTSARWKLRRHTPPSSSSAGQGAAPANCSVQ